MYSDTVVFIMVQVASILCIPWCSIIKVTVTVRIARKHKLIPTITQTTRLPCLSVIEGSSVEGSSL